MIYRPIEAKNIPSLIKWTGSKRIQAKKIVSYIKPYNRYFEPFLGGGALLYLLAHQDAYVSDIYEPLVNLWILIQEDPDAVIFDYKKKWQALDAEYQELQKLSVKNVNGLPQTFYEARRNFNETHNPLELNFIMRTCVNGIVRFNNDGDFNNSFHLSRQGMKPEQFQKNVMLWHKKLKGVIIKCQDYSITIGDAKTGDFIYFDPPYFNNNNRYIKDLDIEVFLGKLEILNSRGVKWALSFDGRRSEKDYTYNLPKELYKRKIEISNGNSAISNILNCIKEEVTESLYLNYI